MPLLITTYTKQATFDTAQAAYEDKRSLYGQEFTAEINQNFDDMLAGGIINSLPYAEWDQETCMLRVVIPLNSAYDFQSSITYDMDKLIQRSELAGWIWLGSSLE